MEKVEENDGKLGRFVLVDRSGEVETYARLSACGDEWMCIHANEFELNPKSPEDAHIVFLPCSDLENRPKTNPEDSRDLECPENQQQTDTDQL